MSIKWEPLPAHKLDTLKNSSLDNLIELYNNGFRFDDGNIPSMSFKNTLDIRTFTYPLGIVSLAPTITLNKTSFIPGEQVIVTMCADQSSSVIATIVEPNNLEGYGPKTIAAGTCITATFNVSNSYSNGTYTIYLKNSSGITLIQKSYTVSGASGTPPPTTQPPTTQPPTTQPPIQCDHNTEISIPPIGCIPKSYLIYGGVGFVLLMLLKK